MPFSNDLKFAVHTNKQGHSGSQNVCLTYRIDPCVHNPKYGSIEARQPKRSIRERGICGWEERVRSRLSGIAL